MNDIEKKQELMGALNKWRRWEEEGKPKHGYGGQYYYDNYHDHIAYEDLDTYRFSIQVYDSPMGDTWWEGRFRTLHGGIDVEIVEEKWRRT